MTHQPSDEDKLHIMQTLLETILTHADTNTDGDEEDAPHVTIPDMDEFAGDVWDQAGDIAGSTYMHVTPTTSRDMVEKLSNLHATALLIMQKAFDLHADTLTGKDTQ